MPLNGARVHSFTADVAFRQLVMYINHMRVLLESVNLFSADFTVQLVHISMLLVDVLA